MKELPNVMMPRQQLLKTIAEKGFNPNSGTAGEAWIDDALGAVLNTLKQLGIDRDTHVVFAPDHGSKSKSSLYSGDGTRIPMIARWPARIRGGLVCDELVQNIDWVPTAFDVAGVGVPPGYRIDGRSLVPLFADGRADGWRDHLYFEMGSARAVATKKFKYTAVRYPKEQVAAIRRASVDRLPRLMSYIGRMGIGVRGAARPGFWDADPLYDLRSDPGELKNLAADPKYTSPLETMRERLTADLKGIGRPFGEFHPGGNAAPPGQVDEQIEQVKKLTIRGKSVVAPDDQPVPAKKARRRSRRQDPTPPSVKCKDARTYDENAFDSPRPRRRRRTPRAGLRHGRVGAAEHPHLLRG